MKVEGDYLGRGSGLLGRGGQERVMGEYDQSTLYICMKMS
jgi:hypothetical protein